MRPYGLLTVPYEKTTSFLPGAALGPGEVARDLERLRGEEGHPGPLRTLALPDRHRGGAGSMIRGLAAATQEVAAAGMLPVMLGGEHTCTLGPLTALRRRERHLGVVHLDAHADVRASYQGSKYSHACVMRRVAEDLRVPHASIGIRAYSAAEARYLERKGIGYIPGHRLRWWERLLTPLLRGLPRRIYLTIDMDFFDPAAVPGVGTPEPGGAGWYQGLAVLDAVLAEKTLVGVDIVELCPPRERTVSVRAASRLLLAVLGRTGPGRAERD